MDIFINTDRPVDRSIVAGINQPQREAPIGAFVAGSSYDVNLYFVKNDGSYNALSGVGGTDIHVAISTISRPESGTFTLTDGTDTTSAISYGASAQVVEDALNALNSDTGLNLGTVSLVDVVKVNDTQYTITFRTFGAMTALSGSTVSLFPESTPTGSIAVTGSSTVYAQQTIELTRQPAIFQETWSTITNGFSGTIALNTTRLLQSLALEPGQPFYLEVKLDAETVAREIVGVEHSTMPASAFSGAAIALKSTEGVDILSTGETGGTKYLREDGDGTSSWQTVAGAAGDMEASTYDPTTVAGDAFDMDNMVEGATTKILTAAERTTIGTVAPHIADTANPHAVTKAQVGLTSVDDTADADKPVSTAQQTAIDAKANLSAGLLAQSEVPELGRLHAYGYAGSLSWVPWRAETAYMGISATSTKNLFGSSSGYGNLTNNGTVPFISDADFGTAADFNSITGQYLSGSTLDLTTNNGDWGFAVGIKRASGVDRAILSQSDGLDLNSEYTLRCSAAGLVTLSVTRPSSTSIDTLISSYTLATNVVGQVLVEFSQSQGVIRLTVNGVTDTLRTAFGSPNSGKEFRLGYGYFSGTVIKNHWNGIIGYFAFFRGMATDAMRRSANYDLQDLQLCEAFTGAGLYLGDSLTRSTHVLLPEVNWQDGLESTLECGGVNYGIGGETSTQIAARAELIPLEEYKSKRVTIWVGNNNSGSYQTVINDTAAIYARATAGGASQIAVLGVTNRYLPNFTAATIASKDAEVNLINAELLSVYGAEFVDMQTVMGTLTTLVPDTGTDYILTTTAYRDDDSAEERRVIHPQAQRSTVPWFNVGATASSMMPSYL